ncbi:General stress protein A [Arsenophonus endosymbiont of Bemisia tabaci Q2]|nr:General stress protein A [Arsenophonus endosymbiont of Bemisia tabaci Q2]
MYFNSKEMILTSDEFSSAKVKNCQFHIAYGADMNFSLGTAISICSILHFNKDYTFHFYIFTDMISGGELKKYDELTKIYNTKITILLIDTLQIKKLPTNKLWSHAIYFRFIIANYFHQKINKILYLDSDIICSGDISELFTTNLSCHIIAAVTDREEYLWKKRAEMLATPAIANGYFNSGVMLIDTDKWYKNKVTEKTINILLDEKTKAKFIFYDQDALNISLVNQVLFLEKKFNTQFSINYELKNRTLFPTIDNVKFIHYIGPTKPWNNWSEYPSTDLFIRIKEKSPWKRIPLIGASTSSQYRYSSKHMFNKKKYIQWLLNYLYYFVIKVLYK